MIVENPISAAQLLNSDLEEIAKWALEWLVTCGPRREKTCLRGFANNTVADQPAHPRSLISAFVIRLLESTMFNLAIRKISIF